MNLIKQYKGLPKEMYILFIQTVINSLGSFVFPFLTLFLSKKIGLGEDEIGKFLLLLSIVTIPGSIFAGKLVDKYNRKWIMVTFRMLSAITFIICGFLGNSMAIPYLLILATFFSSFSFPATNAMTTDITTPENRQRCFSFIYLGMNLGLAGGFLLAGFLFEKYTKWLFWGDGITSIIALLLVVIFIKDTKPTEKEILELDNSDRVAEKKEQGSVISVLLKRPFLLAFSLISAVIGFVYHQHSFIMPLQLTEIFGDGSGAKLFGQVMTLNTMIVIFFTAIIMNLTKEIKPLINVGISVVTYIIGFGMLFFAKSMSLFFISVIIWTIGEIISAVNVGVYISNHSPITHRGRFNSIIGLIRGTGQSLAPYVMGKFLMGHSYAEGWILTAIVAIASLIMIIALYYSENKHYRVVNEPSAD